MSIPSRTPRRLVSLALTRLDRRTLDHRRRRSGRVQVRFLLEPLEDRRLLSNISSITEFSAPSASPGPNAWAITTGSDGNLWFTESTSGKIGIINPTTDAITELSLPTVSAGPRGITSGPDGNLWFTENSVSKIGMVNPSTHVVTEFATKKASSGPQDITVGPDGNLWFTEFSANKIGVINPTTHLITEFAVPTSASQPYGITTGPDGNLWFSERLGYKIGMINPTTHVITEFVNPSGPEPEEIATGPDGYLWFGTDNSIEKLNPATHVFTKFATTNGASGILTGPDGNVWFTEGFALHPAIIARIDPSTGALTEYGAGASTFHTFGLTVGPDGNLWFTDAAARARVGVATLSANQLVVTQQPPATVTAGDSFGLTVQAVDNSGNPLTTFNGTLTAATNNSGTAVLGGTTTATAINGVATFSGLTLPTTAGSSYTINVSGGGFGWGITSSITVVAATTATQVVMWADPPAKVGVGQAFSLQAALADQYGNVVTTATNTLSIAWANNPTGATLGGALSAAAVQGVATFSGLTISKVGSGYTLQVTGAGLGGWVTVPIDVTKKAQSGLAASSVAGPSVVPANALVLDSPGLWDGLGRKKKASYP
jgi:streptogramin lyase